MTPKQEQFVREYLIDLNATQAARRAGYSEATANEQGARLLANVSVQEAIAAAKAARAKRTEVTADRVLRELALIGFADIGEVIEVEDDGGVSVRKLDGLPKRVRRSIAELTQTTSYGKDGDKSVRLSLKHHSKTAALKMLMDHLGMASPTKHQHMGKDGGPIQVHDMRTKTERELLDIIEAGDLPEEDEDAAVR